MASDISHEILKHIERLAPHEQLEVLQQLKSRSPAAAEQGEHSILELEGLGREIWRGVDAQEYVRSERESWSGQEPIPEPLVAANEGVFGLDKE